MGSVLSSSSTSAAQPQHLLHPKSSQAIIVAVPHYCAPAACSGTHGDTKSSGPLSYVPLTSPTQWKNFNVITMLSAIGSTSSSLRLIFYVKFLVGLALFEIRGDPKKLIEGKELAIGNVVVMCCIRACLRAQIVVRLRTEKSHSCMTEENVISSSTGKNLA